MTTPVALLVFLVVPLALVGLITGTVYLTTSRDPRTAPRNPPVGVTPVARPCRVDTTADGAERHETAGADSDSVRCWTLSCAECADPYHEDTQTVHFRDPDHALTTARARGWTLAGHRMRCRRCV